MIRDYGKYLLFIAIAILGTGMMILSKLSSPIYSPPVDIISSDSPIDLQVEKDLEISKPQIEPTGGSIKFLYPTKSQGRAWSANWSNGISRHLASGQRDPYDLELIVRGNGSLSTIGDGEVLVKGEAPRMYVYDADKKKKWGNVEITIYLKRMSETTQNNSQGIVIGARSEHQDATLSNPCYGQTYYGRLLYDGRAVFQKEVIHEAAYSSNKPKEGNKAEWHTSDGSMPRGQWIGAKFVVKNIDNDRSVKLELYRDLTDGKNGGVWEKVAEYIDNGKWAQTDSNIDVNEKCGFLSSHVLLDPGTSVFVRNDNVENVKYKLFSIREIE